MSNGPFDLSRISALTALSLTGSVARAAEFEGTSRATLSRRLHELQAQAGVPLIESSGSGTLLTEAGAKLAATSGPLIIQAERLVGAFSDVEVALGHHRMAVQVGLAPSAMGAVTRAGRKLVPDFHIKMIVTTDPVEELRRGADLAVVLCATVEKGPWFAFVLKRMPVRLMASPSYLDEHGEPSCLEDLEEHVLIHWDQTRTSKAALPLRSGGLHEVRPWLRSEDSWFVRSAAEAGTGIGLIPWGPTGADQEHAPPLVHVLPDLVGGSVKLQGLVARRHVSLATGRVLVEVVRRGFARL